MEAGELSRNLNAEATAGAIRVSLIGLTVMLKAKPPSASIDAAIASTLTILKEENE